MTRNDPYLYPGTNVLKNSLDIHDAAELARYEANTVMVKFGGLLLRGVPGELGPEWYRRVHSGLFGEVYPSFAGSFRTINFGKEGEIVYADTRFLEENALKIFGDLKAANDLRGLERDVFIARLASVMGDLHHLHPFREGNTRTLQVATAEIAYRAGHALAWQRADPATIRIAGNAAIYCEFEPYQKILLEICGEPQPQSR